MNSETCLETQPTPAAPAPGTTHQPQPGTEALTAAVPGSAAAGGHAALRLKRRTHVLCTHWV